MSLIKSMTGYGRAVETVNGREFTVEIRSVNNRYLDCNVKLPRTMGFAEDAIKALVKNAISRGKVDVYVSVGADTEQEVCVTLNKPVLEGYLKAMVSMIKDYGVQDDISVSTLSRMPDVFQVEKPDTDEDALKNDLLSVAGKAIEAYNAMRATEGAAMEQDLRNRSETILNLVSQVEEGSVQTLTEYRNRLLSKMQELLETTAIDENRILQEAAIFADKIAVDEETVRLRSHLAQMDSMLTDGGAVGRKLDFLLQEMNRETNTIGSKCNDLHLSQLVVEIKAELEKIREQIQNIE